MQAKENIIDCYNKTAENYAEKYINELAEKHLDRILLNSFAIENHKKGKLIDLGCGPGQTTKHLSACGITDLVGVDLAPAMLKIARKLNPSLSFEVADILGLKYPDNFFGSAIAFYSIVHFDYEQVLLALIEIKRVLVVGGQLLFSFHVGDTVVHRDTLLDHEVDIDFYFFDTNRIVELVKEAGFEQIDVIERHPYPEVEYASKRAYIWAKT